MNQTAAEPGMRVLVVDDHALVRTGMRRVLEDNPAVAHIEEAASGEEAIERVASDDFGIVLMDINLPGMSGLETSERLLRRDPDLRIIIVTGRIEGGSVRHLLNVGVRAYITKDSNASEIGKAIGKVLAGDQYLSPDVAQQIAIDSLSGNEGENPFDRLTTRERQIVEHLLQGERNRQISEALHISEKTVSTHRTRAFDKLGVSNAAELVRLALRHDVWHID
ncbi:MAG: hypothetical protein CSB44_09140 [Gammaproteobacteria bacterium]|nr:MAG: hypothetical protein CSB44_09140 [Gammaproteobacteria bacterium]PIE36610.1 MAG: hypothetical protein CSA54_03950 [Gammaproteobacteria bacterium]